MKDLLTGDEAVARGAYEAGVLFASAYPGTPSTEILENMATYKEIDAEWAPNEKVAAEAAIGASLAGVRSLAAMKHVGVNVAADPMFTFAYMGVSGGMVLVSADDPSMHSSQNEQDNRNYARHMMIPMFEPADSQESKDMIIEAFDVSEKFDAPVLFRMTTRVCHSKSLVELGERKAPVPVPYVKNRKKNDPVPAMSRLMRVRIEERNKKLREYSENCRFNTVEYNDKKIGVVANGISYQYAREVFGDKASYLKLGFTHPLPMDMIRTFRAEVDALYIIEELDPFMELEIKAAGIDCIGKDKIPNYGELNPNIIAEALCGATFDVIDHNKEMVVERPPVLCAGCPHRPFYFELAKKKDTVIVGDIGCYALGGSEPLNAKDLANCMGSAFSIAHGMKKGFEASEQNKHVVATMGDSTFFHTGVNSLMEVVYNKSNVICCILDNRITGMTGHQENPGTGYRLQGQETAELDIETLVRACGVSNIRTVNPLNLRDVREAINWAFAITAAPAVIITKWPCVLKKLSAQDKKEFAIDPKPCIVDDDLCVGCKACLRTGCPALKFDGATKKAAIDPIQCVGCMVCAQVCPKKAIAKGA